MFILSHSPIDSVSLKAQTINPKSGGFVCFEGWVRNHNENKDVLELHYEAHEKLAVRIGQEIIESALIKFDINEAVCCHRLGELEVGDLAIWVGVSANHRRAAFEACEYILNQTKAEVPIWKNEHYSNGLSGWVEANSKL